MNKPEWNFLEKTFVPSFPLKFDLQFFAADPELYSFGLADITISMDGTPIVFDGQDYLQVDGGEISLTPKFKELNFKDTGDTIDQRRLDGWDGSVTFVVGQEDLKLMKLALGPVTEIMSVDATPVAVGLTDAKMGTILEGYEVKVHPRVLPVTDKRFDYTIYKMASTGGITKPYNNEQTSYTITLTMMPRDGFDATQGSNFFYTGPLDPNA